MVVVALDALVARANIDVKASRSEGSPDMSEIALVSQSKGSKLFARCDGEGKWGLIYFLSDWENMVQENRKEVPAQTSLFELKSQDIRCRATGSRLTIVWMKSRE